MGVTKSTAASRTSVPRNVSRLSEFLLLLLFSALGIAGIYLVSRAQTELSAASGVTPININEIKSIAELTPALGFFENPKDRDFAASAILKFIGDKGPVESISALRAVSVQLSQIRRLGKDSAFVERVGRMREAGNANMTSMPLLTMAQIRQMRPGLSVRSLEAHRRLLYIYASLYFLPFFITHIVWRIRRFAGDCYLLPSVLFLSSLGFTMMIRLRDPLRDGLLMGDFAIGAAVGCVLAILASAVDYEHSPLKKLAYAPLLLSFILSLLLIVFGSGPGVSDAKVNLNIGPFQFQPVELIKLLLLFFLAGYFADRWEFLRKLRQAPETLPWGLRLFHIPKLRYAVPLIVAVAFAIAFFFLAKDLGPALVMTILFILLYSIARSRAVGAVAACAALIAAVSFGYSIGVPRTVSGRLSMWLSPWDNFVRTGGDHLAQSLWSFSSGGFWGSGLGLGEPASAAAAHTDLILAAIGEELGFIAIICIGIVYALLIHRAFRISLKSRGHYSYFLGMAAALLIALQAAFIASGILGLVPLSGVVTPFINYGKSSMISNLVLIGILASISRNSGDGSANEPFKVQTVWVGRLLAAIGILIIIQAARVQAFQSDAFMSRTALVFQRDGHRRYAYNPRIMQAARSIPRGVIYDRNGIPLAASSAALLSTYNAQYQKMGIDIEKIVNGRAGRLYPLGPSTFHVLGDLRTRLNWGASNSSYIERDLNPVLQGYDSHDRADRVIDDPKGDAGHLTLFRDLRELVPLVRYRYRPDRPEVKAILDRDRDIHLTIDASLQKRLPEILSKRVAASGADRGAAVVIDPASGDLLALASYPQVDIDVVANNDGDDIVEKSELAKSLLDRVRFGLYPPGSAFKLVTSIAALRTHPEASAVVFECKRLSDGRIGNYVRGWGRPIRDDVQDKIPHGKVNLSSGLIHSCNAYFAQLGATVVGPQALLDAANLFNIKTANPNTADALKDALPQAAYGQGQVVATPLQLARVAGSIVNHGRLAPARINKDDAEVEGKLCLPAEQAEILAQHMRSVVTEGTGSAASGSAIPIAGKTGTAEVRDHPSHAWFVGFAPYGAKTKKVAFAILIENGRYGGKAAAPASIDIIRAAADAGLLGAEK